MESIVFWNIGKKELFAEITDITTAVHPSIFAIAEAAHPTQIRRALDVAGIGTWREVTSTKNQLRVFSRLPLGNITLLQLSARYVILKVKGLTIEDFLLCCAHLPSQNDVGRPSVESEARCLGTDLRDIEKNKAIDRSIIIGDLNLHPFDDGIVNLDCLGGMMTRRIADRRPRVVNERSYPLRYNPLWKLLGNENGPSGTAYYSLSGISKTFWCCYDQILLSRGILPSVADKDIDVITMAGVKNLTTKHHTPDRRLFSDHLPLSCKIRS